jgi:hypothetical protein
MAYEIKLVAENTPIILDNEKGLRVLALYEDDKFENSKKISIGGFVSTTKSQIRSIKKVEDSSASMEKNNDVTREVDIQHYKYYNEWKTKTPEQKANRDSLFKEVYKAIHAEYPNEETLTAFKNDSNTFFKENPNRTYQNPDLFMKHSGGEKAKKLIISKYQSTMLRVLEKVLVEDMRMARN